MKQNKDNLPSPPNKEEPAVGFENAFESNRKMHQVWRQKLWIDFDRDNKMDTIQIEDDQQDQSKYHFACKELRLDNHAATEDYLSQLYDHVRFSKSKTKLLRLEIIKVLFTGPKAQLLANILSHENCRVIELVFDRCRAKSEKMGKIFEALAKNNSVANLTLRNMNIPRDSLTAMGDMLSGDKTSKSGNQTLQMLTLYNAGLSDNSIQILASGLEQSHGLIYLDVRQNNFENLGFQELAKSLTGQFQLLTLRINAVLIEREELKILQNLFSHENCQIQNLEMEELEINDSMSKDLIEAVSKLKQLFTFDFSNNLLPALMTQSIANMCNQFPMLEILCLDHCEMTDDICRQIFLTAQNTKLQFLNISWNQLSGDSVDQLVRVVRQNQSLEKLAMQHNRFGEGDLSEFASEVQKHENLTYLDISANCVGNSDFKQLFTAVQNPKSKISTFHCRKNRVGGAEIDKVLSLTKSHNLSVLDLTSNKLSEENSYQLLSYAQENVNLEQLNLAKNLQVNAMISNDIIEECRQNSMIKKRILPNLGLVRNADGLLRRSSCYRKYDVSTLSIVDERLDHGDFIQKFIRQNQMFCKKLEMKNIDLGPAQTSMIHIFDPQHSKLNFLHILHIEDINLGPKAMRRVVRNLRKMKELTELHLVNLEALEPLMDTLAESIQKHKKLKVLDLRQTTLRTRDVSALIPLLAKNHIITDVNISDATISKKNMMHLWMALHANISVCQLTYSRTNFLSITEMVAIDHELDLNMKIKNSISPKVLEYQRKHNTNKEMNLRGMQYQPQMNPAIIKYIKSHQKLRSLDLSNTGLRYKDIQLFIEEIAKQNIRLETLNLSENDTVDDKVVEQLCYLFTSSSTIVHLYLNRTKITLKSLHKIFISIKDSLKVRTIGVEGCNFNLKQRFGQEIVAMARDNISLTVFGYRKNSYDKEFHEGIREELALNLQIVEQIFPQLTQQESEARAEQRIKRMNAKQNKVKNRQRRQQTGKSFKSGSSLIDVSELRRASSESEFEGILVSHRSSNDDRDRRRHSRRGKKDLLSSVELAAISPLTRGKKHQNDFDARQTPELLVQDEDEIQPKVIIPKRRSSVDCTKRLSKSKSNLIEGVNVFKMEESDLDYTSSAESVSEEENSDDMSVSSANDGLFLDKLQGNNSRFNLQMQNCDLTKGIGFVTKFTRVFRQIKQIDFGNQKLEEDQMQAFGDVLKVNKYIQKVCYKKKDISKHQMLQIEEEIEKNKAIYEVNQAIASGGLDATSKKLDLGGQSLKNLRFLPKMIKEFKNLETLDLSKADLRTSESISHVCKMIDENDTLECLILQECNINGNTLSKIADALTKKNNRNLKTLDIRKNPIQDEQYKVLFGLLQNNRDILEIKYDLYDENNLHKMEKFRTLQEEGESLMMITQKLKHDDHEHHHRPIPLWQKLVFPIWCWKSLIHDKHEAFAFKYDTREIEKVEKIIMPGTKKMLYFWTFIYYLIVFVAPPIFKLHSCEKTFHNGLFILYCIYLFLTSLWEIKVVYSIQRLLGNKKLLSFNKWHVVELFMGAIARTDTFLDICFIHILIDCWSTYVHWIIPSLTFAIINLVFPLFMLVKLIRNDLGNALFQPNLESTCFASFIRENMLLATVLDSFCINNSFYMLGRPFVFGKLMGFISFFTQDFPQLTIHVMFKLLILSEAQYKLKTQSLLLYGMICSSFAVLISLFNLIMCSQNEFDPITLETELQKRRNDIEARKAAKQNMDNQFKRQKTVASIGLFKRQIQEGLNASLLQSANKRKTVSTRNLFDAGQNRGQRSQTVDRPVGLNNSLLNPLAIPASQETGAVDKSSTGMVGGLFLNRMQAQVQEHKEDRSKAAIQLKSYMAYLNEEDQQSKANNRLPAIEPKYPHREINTELITEDNEEGENDTSRGFLLNKEAQPSDQVPKKSNKVHFAPAGGVYEEKNEVRSNQILMQDFPSNISSPSKDGLIKGYRRQQTSQEKASKGKEAPQPNEKKFHILAEKQKSFNSVKMQDEQQDEFGLNHAKTQYEEPRAALDLVDTPVQMTRPSLIPRKKQQALAAQQSVANQVLEQSKAEGDNNEKPQSTVPSLPPLGESRGVTQEQPLMINSLGSDFAPNDIINSQTSFQPILQQRAEEDSESRPFSFTSPQSPQAQQEAIVFNPFSAQEEGGPSSEANADNQDDGNENRRMNNRGGRQQAIITLESGSSGNYDEDAKTL